MLPNLIEIIKKAALDAVKNSDPACIMYGKVTKVNPLKIQVNKKLTLTADQLILTKNVSNFSMKASFSLETSEALGTHSHDFNTDTDNALGDHSHSISLTTGSALGGHTHTQTDNTETSEVNLAHTHDVSGNTGSENLQHSHSISGSTGTENLKHKHTIEMTGTKTITVDNSLKKGDEVILLRQAGGQEYIVLDKVG